LSEAAYFIGFFPELKKDRRGKYFRSHESREHGETVPSFDHVIVDADEK
jgi:hypothetical protein